MTYSEDFPVDGGQDLQGSPEYPTAFGITLTPTVSGVLIAVLGVLGAAYLLTNLVQPAWENYQQLQAQKETKETQIAQLEATRKKVQDVKARLEQAKRQKAEVLALFPNEKTLDTLLLDLNRSIDARQGQLIEFDPDEKAQGAVVADGSFGPLVNGKLKRETIVVKMKGSFPQIQSIMRRIEQFQPLLLIKDLKSDRVEPKATQKFVVDPITKKVISIEKPDATGPLDERPTEVLAVDSQGRIITRGEPTIESTFKIEALLPVTSAATPAPTPAQQPPKK